MLSRPTQSVPGGFLLVFFGVLFLIASGLAGYAGYLVFYREVMEGNETVYSYRYLFLGSGLLLLLSVASIYWGIKLAIKVGPYDTRSPREPRLKF